MAGHAIHHNLCRLDDTRVGEHLTPPLAGRRKSQAGDKALLGHDSPPQVSRAVEGTPWLRGRLRQNRGLVTEGYRMNVRHAQTHPVRHVCSEAGGLFTKRWEVCQRMPSTSLALVFNATHVASCGRSSSSSPAATGEVVRAAGPSRGWGLAGRGAPVDYRRSGRARGRLRRRSGDASWRECR